MSQLMEKQHVLKTDPEILVKEDFHKTPGLSKKLEMGVPLGLNISR